MINRHILIFKSKTTIDSHHDDGSPAGAELGVAIVTRKIDHSCK